MWSVVTLASLVMLMDHVPHVQLHISSELLPHHHHVYFVMILDAVSALMQQILVVPSVLLDGSSILPPKLVLVVYPVVLTVLPLQHATPVKPTTIPKQPITTPVFFVQMT